MHTTADAGMHSKLLGLAHLPRRQRDRAHTLGTECHRENTRLQQLGCWLRKQEAVCGCHKREVLLAYGVTLAVAGPMMLYSAPCKPIACHNLALAGSARGGREVWYLWLCHGRDAAAADVAWAGGTGVK